MFQSVKSSLLEQGYMSSILALKDLEIAKHEMESLYESGLLDDAICKLVRSFHRFDIPNYPFPVRSVIIVASYSPQVYARFHYHGNSISLLIPPTYIDYPSEPITIERLINEKLCKGGYQARRTHNLPEKLLAVASGLSKYGKNNLSYVPGMGSFVLLSAYYSSLPFVNSTYHELKMLDACKTCKICLKHCPTGAISADRDIIRAEKCLTYLNEFTETMPFPNWLDPSAHHCLIGCMRCQWYCPHNRPHLKYNIDSEEFSEEETTLLLQNKPLGDLPGPLSNKLKQINFVGFYYPFLTRNLATLLKIK